MGTRTSFNAVIGPLIALKSRVLPGSSSTIRLPFFFADFLNFMMVSFHCELIPEDFTDSTFLARFDSEIANLGVIASAGVRKLLPSIL